MGVNRITNPQNSLCCKITIDCYRTSKDQCVVVGCGYCNIGYFTVEDVCVIRRS